MITETNPTYRFTNFYNALVSVGAYYRAGKERACSRATFDRSLPLNLTRWGLMNSQETTRQLKCFMTNEKRIRALVNESKPRARAMVREIIDTGLLERTACECTNGRETAQETESLSADVIFLNVELPDGDVLRVLESLKRDHALLVILVNRARHRIVDQASERREQEIWQLLERLKGAPEYIERLVIKAEGRIFLLDVDDIHYIQAEGNYVAVHNGQKEYLLRETISSLEARLDPRKFLRVHRSAIVKIDKIRELQPWFHGEFRIILDGGKQLMLSRNYRVRLQKAIGNAL
jgi:two-component system, LytTR family, response regulator